MSTAGMINIQFPEQEHGVLSRLNAMRQQGQLCDVAVRAGQQEFPCHRAVLAASCGHFHSIFVQGVLCFPNAVLPFPGSAGVLCFPKKPTKETLDLSFISAEVFSIILDYIYTANLQCPAGMIEGVLQAAKLLEIEPLMRQLPVFVGDTAPITSLNHVPGVSVGGSPISYLNRGPSLNVGSPLNSSLGDLKPVRSYLGETPVSSLTHAPSVSVNHPSDTVSSVVATSKTSVPESLAEMLTEPEENVHGDQPTSQRALDSVVVKQELPDLPDASQDTWTPPSPGFPPIPHLSPDNSEDESEMSSWCPWVNDEYSRVLSVEKVTELEQNCRRCGRKDNSVRYFIRALKEWCLARNKPTDFETLPCGELSRLLQQFYYELHNPAGGRYGAQTMLAFRSAIKTYLIHHPAGTGYNIISDAAFTAANKTLQQVLKDCSIGFEAKCGIKSLNIPDLQKLFDTRTLGTSTPVSLQRLVWFYFTVHFHIRTPDEWLRLKKEDLTLHEDLTLQDQLGKEDAINSLILEVS
ncbi:Zinc finger and BTB domain-containing protein 7A [Branchiostoma belcheri]|nr:Zinc finger and BTB domain-containing protein 7A [Branchiostoma belcheri]